MGTNYYASPKECPHCGRGGERVHIGKSSAGWVFALATHKELGIERLEDWLAYLPGKTIRDEYGKYLTVGEMVERIVCRSHPNGDLLRSPDAVHGAGTWDCHTGEFC